MLEGSILKKLIDGRNATSGGSTLNFGVYYKNTLVALCHALEDYILNAGGSPLVVTAFQQGKWYLQEADRYGAIADHAQQIVIMAAPDSGFHSHPTSQRTNVALVDLDPNDPVAQEWHLMIWSPDYTAMVLCQELLPADYGHQGIPENDLERKFYGFWTFEPELVKETFYHAIAHLGKYNPELQTQLQQQLETLAHTDGDHQGSTADGVRDVVGTVVDYLQSSRRTVLSQGDFSFLEDLEQNLVANNMQAFLRMAQLVDLADTDNPLASVEVSALAEMMGQMIDLPAWQLQRLKLASLVYRIAPMPIDIDPPNPGSGPSCPLVPGAQVLRRMPRMRAVAEIVTHQNEWWDGNGHPAGLTGDEIPLESRVLGLVAAFQKFVVQHQAASPAAELGSDAYNQGLAQAMAECKAAQGTQWDPKLVEILGLIVQGLQQGLSLPSIPTRMTVVTGLLNPDATEMTEAAGVF